MSSDPAAASPIPSLESIATPIIAPLPDRPVDIIPGLLPRQGQLVIAGETNVGKSLVALEICSSLSTGGLLWGELEPTSQAKKILYVLGEHYNEVIQRLWQVTRLPMSDQVWILGPEDIGYDKWLVAQGKPSPTAIDKFKYWAKDVDLIVFDPFSAFVSGVDVENDNVQMRLALDTMSLIAQSAGASCLVLAHQGKPTVDHKTGQERARKSYAIRGASSIEDAATNIFYMSHTTSDPEVAKKYPKDAKLYKLTQRKYKGIAPPYYDLLRNNSNLTHELLGENNTFSEVRRKDLEAKMYRMHKHLGDDIPRRNIIKLLADLEGCGESTIYHYLKEKE